MSPLWEIGKMQLGTFSCEKGRQLLFTKIGGVVKKQNWGGVRVVCKGGVKQHVGVFQMKAAQCAAGVWHSVAGV